MFDRFVSMINFLEIKNGVLMVSAFVENNNFYFYDPGFRLQGEAPNKIIAAANNINQMELLIHFAFTGKMDEKKLLSSNDAGLDGLFGASVWFLLKEGKIAKIKKESNDSEIKWIDFSQRLYEGDYVLPEMVGTEAQVLARAYLLEKSQEQLKKRIKETQQCIEVADTLGNNMLLEGFEYE
jgi:hypothetical protein